MRLFASSREPEPDKHKYIRLIEFALQHGEFTVNQACSECGLSEKQFRFVAPSIFALNMAQASPSHDSGRKVDWILKPEAYFSYLQYLEFRHAIEAAKRSYWLAVLAIVIAIIAAAISVHYGR